MWLVFIGFMFLSLCFNSTFSEKLTPIEPIFGTYDIEFKSTRNCRESKPSDLVKTELNLKTVSNQFNLFVNFTFRTTIKIDFARMSVYRYNENSKKVQVFDHRTQKPCEHFIIAPSLRMAFNINSSCIVGKGTYSADMDLNILMKQTLSNRIILGHYEYTSLISSKKKRLICGITRIDFLPSKN